MSIKQILLWFPMIAIAFCNAAIRESVLVKFLNEHRAHQLSTITLIIFCSIYIWLIFGSLDIHNTGQALLIGFVWAAMTVVFEFSLGLLTNRTWEYMLRNYDIFDGHIWPVFLVILFLLPYICYMIRK